jgi:hypothetical protein
VQQGATGAGETYTCNTVGTITFGTTNITFAQISSAQIYSAGTGLTLTGTQFSITNTGTAGTYGSASTVPVFVTNAQGQVTSVTPTAIAITGAAVSGDITGKSGGTVAALTAGTFLTSGGTFDGSTARTFAVDATSANTADKVVSRDASGNFSAGTITATLSGAATSATTATNLAGGAANQIPFQTGAGATAFAVAPTVSSTALTWNGSAFAWSALGSTINNDTTTATDLFPIFSNATSGTATTVFTSNAKLLYKPSTGELQASAVVASNGIVVNSATVAVDYTIPSGSNAMSAGPVSINSGITVTVSSGSTWVVV